MKTNEDEGQMCTQSAGRVLFIALIVCRTGEIIVFQRKETYKRENVQEPVAGPPQMNAVCMFHRI